MIQGSSGNETLCQDLFGQQTFVNDFTDDALEWTFYNRTSPVMYTYSPQIPWPHCNCGQPAPFVPEFLSLANATCSGKYTRIRGEWAVNWTAHSVLTENDTYTVWVSNSSGLPLRAEWVDPYPGNSKYDIIQTTNYYNLVNTSAPPNTFLPNKPCANIKCGAS